MRLFYESSCVVVAGLVGGAIGFGLSAIIARTFAGGLFIVVIAARNILEELQRYLFKVFVQVLGQYSLECHFSF